MVEFAPYFKEFLVVFVAMFFALLSPGPDFAFVLKQSVCSGRRASIYTSIGLGFGVMVHIGYSILGIGLIISKSIILFNIIKLCGAFYLIYIGYKSLKSQGFKVQVQDGLQSQTISVQKSFLMGFLCNILNPKAALFFISLFTAIIDISTPIYIQIFYGMFASLFTMVWFSTLSVILSQNVVRDFFNKFGKYFDRTIGFILIGLGIKIAFVER